MHPPYATSNQPGCGGNLRVEYADFQVEEVPAYLPSGIGEHLYLWVEKRGISTANLRSALCRKLGLMPVQIGHAGLKDSNAVSRQWISVHSKAELPLELLQDANFSLLDVGRHGNKLRPGHLKGNRFRITIRNVSLPETFETLLQRLQKEGFPNYFGEQRFGVEGDNAPLGRAILRSPGKPPMARDKARFLVHAYQSELFNRLVAQRLKAFGSISRMLPGDLAIFQKSASLFSVLEDDLERTQQRATAGELAASACLFGYKAPLAEGLPGKWERELLQGEGLGIETFNKGRKSLSFPGERRAVRAFPEQLRWNREYLDGLPCLRLTFTLKPGVYATSFLREVMKPDTPTRQHDSLINGSSSRPDDAA